MDCLEIKNSKIILLQGDITRQDTEAIVNAANSSLLGGGGVDGAIHRAGGKEILEECKKIRAEQGGCRTGEAVITTGGKLQAKYVIHTVGPVWRGGGNKEESLLRSCYRKSLELALVHNIRTISFPSISTGVYGYPVEQAAPAALKTVRSFLEEKDGIKEVFFVLFDSRTYETYKRVLNQLLSKGG